MTNDRLEKLAAAPVDETTRALIEEALAEAARGEVFTEEEVESYIDGEYQAWLVSQQTAIPA